jgi:S1-C subfamily serine protease
MIGLSAIACGMDRKRIVHSQFRPLAQPSWKPGQPTWKLGAVLLGGIALCAAALTAIAADALPNQFAYSASDAIFAADASALELQSAFDQIQQRVSPSVVSLQVTREATITVNGEEQTLAQLVRVNGTGCVVDSAGLILTNEHVVHQAITITVILHDGTELPGTLWAADIRHDLAIISVPCSDLQPVRWCQWDHVRRGQWLIAIGNPYGLARDGQASLAVGVIANLGRRLPNLGLDDDRLYTNLIQTTTPVHPGNSGGPLFNLQGEVVGIVTAVYLKAGVDNGVGFAIAASPDKRAVIRKLIAGQPDTHAYLGLIVQDLSPKRNAQPRPTVIALDPESPAAEAGVQVGDVIETIAGEPITTSDELAERITSLAPEAQITLSFERDGKIIATRTVLEKRVRGRITWMRHTWLAWRGARFESSEQGADE